MPGPSSPRYGTLTLQLPWEAVTGGGLPILLGPSAISSWLAAGPPHVLHPENLQASLLPSPVPKLLIKVSDEECLSPVLGTRFCAHAGKVTVTLDTESRG